MMANMDSEDLAVAASLLKDLADVKQNSKCDALEELVAGLSDKIIIFTEYKASQEYIRYRLEKAGYSTWPLMGPCHGKKTVGAPYVSTGSPNPGEHGVRREGLNFQFCNQVVSFDLPWNPMRLEQRIGRVHRLGQTRDVHIFNLLTKDTIEEHIMYLLHEKINMFETIIGELDTILLHLNLGRSFESAIMDIFLAHEEKREIREQLDRFGERFIQGQSEVKTTTWDIL